MTSISQILNQVVNDMSELRKDVTAIQRTLVRMEAASLQPVCRTRRHSASRATQTWPNQQQTVHRNNQCGSSHFGGTAQRTTNFRGMVGSVDSSVQHTNGYPAGPMRDIGPVRNISSLGSSRHHPIAGNSQRIHRPAPTSNHKPAGPAEERLSTMRKVLNKAANTPVKSTCRPPIQMSVDSPCDQENLPPPLQPEVLTPDELDDIPEIINPLSSEMEEELLDVSD